ncbi:ABC transporter permease [Vibrio sp. MA40-2]|uniref:ABC transporter permease n=1 Tax=Vibrio sp. MA40-2 TaxID=3391828 RepID=UPI0039A6DA84
MLWPVVKALLGHYRRHPLQLLLVWFGLTLGVSVFVGVAAINQHAKESYQHSEILFTNPLPYRITPKYSADKIPQGFYIQLRREGFNQCVPFDNVKLETQSGQDLSLVGIDPFSLLGLASLQTTNDVSILQLTEPNRPLLMSSELAEYLGKKSGDFIRLSNGNKIGPLILDHNEFISGTRLLADISKVRETTKEGGFSLLACENMPQEKLDTLRRILPNGMTLSKSSRVELESLTQAFHLNLSAMGMLAFVVGVFIFYQAMSLSFIQRQTLVGVMRQAGVSGWHLTKALALELLLFIFVGWFFGNVFGLMLANKLMPSVSTTLADLYAANISLTVDWNWQWSKDSLIMAILGTMLACSWPLVRLVRTPPIRLSSKLSLVRFAGREFAWQAIAASVFCFAAIGVYQLPATPMLGFIIVALLLLSVALFMPFVIFELFTAFSFSLRWTKVRWFFSDAASSMSFRGVAVMAFMLAMSANITVETLVGSFRATTENWLTQRLAADIYIYPTKSSASRMSNWLANQPDVKDVWWRWEIDIATKSGVLEVVSTGNSEGEQSSVPVKIGIPDYWYHLNHSKGVMISEAMALKERIRPGDKIQLGSLSADKWQVVGVYYDYGNPYNQVLMSQTNWISRFGGQGNIGLGVIVSEKTDTAALIERLRANYAIPVDRVLQNKNLHNQAMRIFDRTFVIADSLGNLTLLIAVFGIFFATLAGEISKQRNTALLRCFGISTFELIALSGIQLFLFGLISAMVAMPLGLSLAKVMVEVVLKESFGWTMPLYVIPWQYLNTFAWAMIALVIAGILPTLGMIKRTPMKSLRDAL